jgi:DNA-binding MarR family transcriptional regulator
MYPTEALVSAVIRLARQLTDASDRLHHARGVNGSMRGVLLCLEANGPMSVSRIAETCGVSRQFQHRLVQSLRAGDWVTLTANPRHKRSDLVDMTDKGRAEIKQIKAIESPAKQQLFSGLSNGDVQSAATLLNELTARLEAHAVPTPSPPP